jgi:aryl-alcohol dehydrogenase-like predicted oxidoreductase
LPVRRKQVVIATKSGSQTKDALLSDLGTSLRELNTDYIDIWHLHARAARPIFATT